MTDSAGKWTSPSFPDGGEMPRLLFQHPEFASDEAYAAPSDTSPLLDGSFNHIMHRGVTTTGIITDTNGRPVAGAIVRRGQRSERHALKANLTTSDAQGHFAFSTATKSGEIVLTIQSPKHAPAIHVASATSDPVTIKLDPANKLTGKVVDENDKPVSGAFVRATTWHGHQTLDWNTQTNSNGEFTWNAAPADTIEITVFVQRRPPKHASVTAGQSNLLKLAAAER
jgi:hypothetical protein